MYLILDQHNQKSLCFVHTKTTIHATSLEKHKNRTTYRQSNTINFILSNYKLHAMRWMRPDKDGNWKFTYKYQKIVNSTKIK